VEDAEADKIVSRVAEHLRQARIAKGLSMNQIASRAGLDQVAISRIEKGERSPALRTLLKIASALEVNLSDILALSQDPENGSP